jgi:hypothetical protein
VVNFIPRPLGHWVKNPVAHWNRRLGGPESRYKRFWRTYLDPTGIRTPKRPARISVLLNIVKVKESRNRPGVAQRVPGSLGSQISMTFGTRRRWGCQPHAPAAFTPRKCSWYSFSLGAESTTGPWYGRKEYATEKSSDTTGKRSRDRPNSNAVP